MTRHCSVNYNEAYVLVLENGCLGIGLGDEDLNYGWLETVSLLAPDITIGEYLEFNYTKDTKYWHCKSIRPYGRFMGYIDSAAVPTYSELYKVQAPIEFESTNRGLRATNFTDQLEWLCENNVWGWSFYPCQSPTDSMIKINWVFTQASDAALFKLTWA